MNIHVVIASWLLHQTTAFLRPLPSAAAARCSALGEGVVDAAPSVEAPRLIGEGVVLDAVPDASPINAGSLFVLAALAIAELAAFLAQNFEQGRTCHAGRHGRVPVSSCNRWPDKL